MLPWKRLPVRKRHSARAVREERLFTEPDKSLSVSSGYYPLMKFAYEPCGRLPVHCELHQLTTALLGLHCDLVAGLAVDLAAPVKTVLPLS